MDGNSSQKIVILNLGSEWGAVLSMEGWGLGMLTNSYVSLIKVMPL